MTETEKDLDVAMSIRKDYKVAILCNTYSTAQDFFAVILNNLNKAIGGSSMLNMGGLDSGPLETIPMAGSNIQVSLYCISIIFCFRVCSCFDTSFCKL